MKQFLILASIFAMVFLAPCTAFAQEEEPASPTQPLVDLAGQIGVYESAIVRDVRLDVTGTDEQGEQIEVYDVEFRTGELKGETRTISSDLSSNPYQLDPKEGDRVVIFLQSDADENTQAYLEGFDRRIALMWLVVLFVLMLVILAGWQGFKTAFSIILSILIIGWVLIPSFLNGTNPVPIALALAAVLTFLSTGLSLGWNRKALITAIGTLGGVLVAYAISVLFSNWAHIGGLSTDEDRLFFSQNPTLNPAGLLFAGVIIAAMGVVEDVAVSIVSGVEEVYKVTDRLSFKKLFTAGMVVGRDHMSALANTLVFAYVGASLSTLLLYHQYGGSWLKFLNFDAVADEVIRSAAGTIGLILTVPVTATLSAFALSRIRAQKQSRTLVQAGHRDTHNHDHEKDSN